MAEIVDYRVERTLDEVNLLVEFGILDKEHAKEILSKRQNFEYTLRRRTKNKLDYLKYIRFEINLLESIEKYKKTIISDYYQNKPEESNKLDEIERKILLLQAKKLNDVLRSRSAHISSLFRKLVYKFQFDTKLWLAYIEFAKKRNWNSRVSALYWRLLRVAGNDESIWLLAAEHEVDVNKAFDNARGLYLRALRHHPKSANIWAEYFKMEMRFMDIVAQRARIIFKVTASMNNEKKEPDHESGDEIWAEAAQTNEDLSKAASDEDDDEHEGNDKNNSAEKEEDNKLPEVKPIEEDDEILTGKLPKVVFDNAFSSLDSSNGLTSFIVKILSYIFGISEETKGLLSVKDYILEKLSQQKDDSRLSNELLSRCRNSAEFQEFVDQLQSSSSIKRAKPANQHSKMDILYDCYEAKGIQDTRETFERLKRSIKNCTLSLYVGMVQVEYWELKKESTDRGDQLTRIRQIYDEALGKFGKIKPKLWYEYLQFEHENAKSLDDFSRINEIYLRAQATLDKAKVDRVIEKYTLMQNKLSNRDLEYSDYSDLED